MSKRIVINAANLHIGGGIQVAVSFLEELAYLISSGYIDDDIKFSVVCSDEVCSNLSETVNMDVFEKFTNENIYGFRKPKPSVLDLFKGYDVAFTVFGPSYYKLPSRVNICGFAQAWIAYPNNLAYRKLSLIQTLKSRLKFSLQWHFFKQSDFLVVEQEHVKQALIRNRAFDESKIGIAHNCVSSMYLVQPEKCSGKIDNKSKIKLGVMGRGYPHKNLALLPEVAIILREKYDFDVDFLFTLTQAEMNHYSFEKISNFYTVGALKVDECVDFYSKIDGLVFPSLLECYSASPVEAMALKVPVFASDLDFVKNVCCDHAFYFDPLDPENIAKTIAEGLSDIAQLESNVKRAYAHVKSLPTSLDRAKRYVDFLVYR
ncbi:glycosyltransferase [Photobacterium atrarenae]|uniref:Glycosyltransferase n=1 Tax=Photobacterium atrarenae TaxID=865757 RepID=A0ABY5GCN3_9GAMM|nr:glycosyltransferase [Photobacterium atrarenae]UTV26970.1 glycosyltransferase [Photobacterium atrarenae]